MGRSKASKKSKRSDRKKNNGKANRTIQVEKPKETPADSNDSLAAPSGTPSTSVNAAQSKKGNSKTQATNTLPIETVHESVEKAKKTKSKKGRKRKRRTSNSEDSDDSSSSSSDSDTSSKTAKSKYRGLAREVVKALAAIGHPATTSGVKELQALPVVPTPPPQFRPAPYPRATPAGSAPFAEQGQWNARQMNAITFCGTTVLTKIQIKIMEDRYVDLKTLLPSNNKAKTNKIINIAEEDTNYQVNINDQGGETHDDKKELTQHQWITCFHDYMGIYLKAFPSAVDDLLAYSKHIIKMQENGQDWRNYDLIFRKSRDTTPYLWTDIMMDSRIEATTSHSKTYSQGQSSSNASQFFRNIRIGFCRAYHDPLRSCHLRDCQYKHSCQICGRDHPLFRHNSQKKNDRGYSQYDRYENRRRNLSLVAAHSHKKRVLSKRCCRGTAIGTS